MKVVAVVQARMGSSRLHGQVMMSVAGAPMLLRMVERVRAAQSIDEVVVATTTQAEDAAIVAICRLMKIAVCAGHPTDLVDRHLFAAQTFAADVVVKIPSDCPLIDPVIIDRVVNVYRAAPARYDFVSNLHPPSYPDGNDVEVIPRKILELTAQEAHKPHEREHTTPFIWDQPERFRIANVPWPCGRDLSMSHRFTIDYREDLEFVRAVFTALYRKDGPIFSLEDILAFLETHPGVFALNRHLAGVNWYRHHLQDLRTVSRRDTHVFEDT